MRQEDQTVRAGLAVHVYRNLTRGRPGGPAVWSVRHRGLVVAHVGRLTVAAADLRVQPGGQARARRTGRRNVHAYVAGTVAADAPAGLVWEQVGYDPFVDATFVVGSGPLTTAAWVRFTPAGCWAAR